MTPFKTLTAVAAPLIRDNVDTDAIIPSREMKTVGKTGLKDGLFAGWRYTKVGGREPVESFVLNQPAYAEVRFLLSGANFGCGSSREHAAWALAEYGIRAVIAVSFNPIFQGNCIRNGIVPVPLPAETIAGLAAQMPGPVTVSLEVGEVCGPDGARHPFAIAEEARQTLLHGLDPIAQTLMQRDRIDAFLKEDRVRRPWAYALPLNGAAAG